MAKRGDHLRTLGNESRFLAFAYGETSELECQGDLCLFLSRSIFLGRE